MTKSGMGALARNIAAWQLSVWAVLSWLPLVRCLFDGDSYVWGQSYYGVAFRAEGVGGDFPVLVIQLIASSIVIWLAFRRPGRLAYLGLIAISAFLTGDILWTFANDPSGLQFHGDTLDIHVNVGHVFLGYFATALLLSLIGFIAEKPSGWAPRAFDWTQVNSAIFFGALAIAPLQFWLLRFGEPHGRTDEIGVILTMAQWAAIIIAISVMRRRAR